MWLIMTHLPEGTVVGGSLPTRRGSSAGADAPGCWGTPLRGTAGLGAAGPWTIGPASTWGSGPARESASLLSLGAPLAGGPTWASACPSLGWGACGRLLGGGGGDGGGYLAVPPWWAVWGGSAPPGGGLALPLGAGGLWVRRPWASAACLGVGWFGLCPWSCRRRPPRVDLGWGGLSPRIPPTGPLRGGCVAILGVVAVGLSCPVRLLGALGAWMIFGPSLGTDRTLARSPTPIPIIPNDNSCTYTLICTITHTHTH